MQLEKTLTDLLGKNIKDSTDSEIYLALLKLVDDMVKAKPDIKKEKKLYYISAEFLIGKLLSNNLINLGIYQEIRGILENNGKDLASIEEIENEPSLGNGGLGRLAACFLDSIATLGLNGDGVGLNYHFGLFKQEYKNNKQYEVKNEWITPNSWLKPTNISFEVPFKDLTVKSVLYDIDVVGYNNGVNSLRLFDIETVDESVVKKGINFDPTDIEKVLTLFLYPDDSTEEGKLLRIYQQYFMVSNAAQLIIHEEKQKGHNLRKLHKHVAVQINDTHPTLVIPELIRLLSKEGIEMKEAIRIVTKTCAYTNHTILSEALEKWPYEYLEKVCPHLMPIIEALDAVAHAKYNDPNVQIIDEERKVHMARICMHYSHSINGVAALHTEILKKSELKPFYKIYAEKFNNKTNGITFRRWLMHANYDLAQWLDSMIGTGWRTNAWDLQKLLYFHNDYNALEAIDLIKQKKKASLIKYIKERENVDIDPNSIFCIQIKRLHEYKRQQMNALYVIYKYLEIKNGNIPVRPITIIFGGKAAPAYTTAKNIIHLIKCLQSLIENDPEVSKHLKVIMVTNYNVSYAEKLIPACDISEQISLASKEASGTGNMKFMLNGAVTLGTIDGANVEIREQVGNENIFTFGESSDQVINHYNNHDYVAKHYYERPNIKRLVDFIDNPEVVKYGDIKCLQDLKNELINKDWFMTLLDLESYINTKEHAFNRFEDRLSWRKMMLVNIAKAGFFSSDRTISEYNKDIWHLDK
ncbi:MAG: glycogen/starch/alpha-glucan phosphorylase [Bacillota bacterium]|nr:glycogen/starch/alpha-glucan phosphorylase [Bacillota bacterium]